MRLIRNIPRYWVFQLVGWGANAMISIFFEWTYRNNFSAVFFGRLAVLAFLGLAFSHMMRYTIIRYQVLQKELEKQSLLFLGITLAFAFLYAAATLGLYQVFDIWRQRERDFSLFEKMFGATFNSFITLLVWNLIYFIYHYIQRIRKQEIESLQLEGLIKELQLKTIKSHINPHFIFNALNSIRAMVDENPVRARKAITELSRILRSSMHAEKTETVSFEEELGIVRDYLALEQMRFEERLKVKFDVDPETLSLQVPPMMLQTLVENAIKHGIGKNINGGEVEIISRLRNRQHELMVRNTGSLTTLSAQEGFGLYSTQHRLRLMYGDDAGFSIANVAGQQVEACVTMPLEK
ncbi:MAG: sensor histidine kinase [Chitinophagaceae bacterium]